MTSASPILVVAATQMELQHLFAWLPQSQGIGQGPRAQYQAHLGNLPIIGVQLGTGTVSAASATEFEINLYQPKAIIVFGSSSSHVRDLVPGDVVIATWVDSHTSMLVLPEGDEMYLPVRSIANHPITIKGRFECDEEMTKIAIECSKNWVPEAWPQDLQYQFQPQRQPMVRVGPILTTDIWIQHIKRIDVLHKRHQSLCADMESAGVAQIADYHEIPFLSIRDISMNDFYEAVNFYQGQMRLPLDQLGLRAGSLTHRVLNHYASLDQRKN